MIVRDVSPLPDQFSIFQLSFSFDFFLSLPPGSQLRSLHVLRTYRVKSPLPRIMWLFVKLFFPYTSPWFLWSGFISVRKGGNDEVLFPVSRKRDVAFMFFFPSLSYFFAIFGHVSSSNSPIFHPPSSCSISGGKKGSRQNFQFGIEGANPVSCYPSSSALLIRPKLSDLTKTYFDQSFFPKFVSERRKHVLFSSFICLLKYKCVRPTLSM